MFKAQYPLDYIYKISQWLSPIPLKQHHRMNGSNVLKGTGSWLLQHRAMSQWESSQKSSILWLHGIPGSGKTKLVSVLVDHLKSSGRGQCLAYFYCSRSSSEPERSDPEQILRSIARQISRYEPGKREPFDFAANIYKEREGTGADIYKEREDTGAGPLDLEDSVNLIIKQTDYYPNVSIVINALDECDEKTRHRLLSALTTIIREASGLVKIFVSSRDEKDIRPRLQDLPNLYIRANDNAEDIKRFVQKEVNEAVAAKRLLGGNLSADLAENIVRTLTSDAQGM